MTQWKNQDLSGIGPRGPLVWQRGITILRNRRPYTWYKQSIDTSDYNSKSLSALFLSFLSISHVEFYPSIYAPSLKNLCTVPYFIIAPQIYIKISSLYNKVCNLYAFYSIYIAGYHKFSLKTKAVLKMKTKQQQICHASKQVLQ